MIKREYQLKKIRSFYDNELIKVLIGIRRCGKSVLLNQIYDEIQTDNDHKIYINFEDLDYSNIQNDLDLFNYIKPKMKDKNKYYLFFDEIQNVLNFEKAINSFRLLNTSIFITGSNSKLLSGELATLLRGRYVSFKIQPFSFSETLEIQNITKPTEENLLEYVKWGGMPGRFSITGDENLKIFFSDLYDSIALKDVIARYKIQNIDLLERIFMYITTSVSQLFSVSSITNFLKNEKRECSKETLYNYLTYITNSCIVDRVKRYDIQGKKTLSTLEKYYLADIAFSRIYSSSLNIGASIENIVYNELINRGYKVDVGIIKNQEIDFIAYKGKEKLYFQVCYLLFGEEIIEREFGAFDKVKDNYPKYVLSLDKFDFSRNGIQHVNLISWLLNY